ncbi:MAG: rhomboid family intramembrane serine protease [Planctomycetes bacterium]|nr:rhomboid family intramembrane serine protease [Planctomycetota bacterium]
MDHSSPEHQPTEAARSAARLRRDIAVFWHALYGLTPRVYVTYVMIAVNVAVFGLMVASGVHYLHPQPGRLLEWGANLSTATLGGEWWRLATSAFLHVGLLHLGINMWALWNIGPLMERFVGNVGFLVLYIVSGLAGGLASLTFNPGVISAGASGAIFGVLGAIVGFVLLRRDSIPGVIFRSLLHNGVIVIAINVVIGMTVPQIDNAAHMGGLAAGFACGVVLSRPLDPSLKSRRWRRNVLVALAGAAACFAWANFLAQNPARFVERPRTLYEDIKQITDEFDRLNAEHHGGRLPAAEFAARLDDDLLPKWSTAHRRLRLWIAAGDDAPQEAKALAGLERFMTDVAAAWRLLSRGLRTDDQNMIDEARRALQQADAGP